MAHSLELCLLISIFSSLLSALLSALLSFLLGAILSALFSALLSALLCALSHLLTFFGSVKEPKEFNQGLSILISLSGLSQVPLRCLKISLRSLSDLSTRT